MNDRAQALQRAPYLLTAGAGIAILFSIAVSQSLMAMAFVALLVARQPIRFPPIKFPLALFFLGTVISMALADNPAAGFPQIKKFYVYLIALLVFSVYRGMAQIRLTVLLWGAAAGLSALLSFAQFVHKYRQAEQANAGFYQFYVGERITGFMSHWMTFGGEEMIVLLMLAAFLFFAPANRWKPAAWAVVALLAASMVLGLTRSVWLGTAAAGLYLLWSWNRRLVLVVPVLVAAVLLIKPVRERAISTFRPHGDTDSNAFRVVVWRTGLRMIRAHPWFGLGPEEVRLELAQYLPPDVPRPLPTGWYGHLHNFYLHYAAERGIPTLLALLWMLGKIVADFARRLRREGGGEGRWVLHGGMAVVIGVMVAGFFEVNLGDSEVLTLFLISVSFGYVACES